MYYFLNFFPPILISIVISFFSNLPSPPLDLSLFILTISIVLYAIVFPIYLLVITYIYTIKEKVTLGKSLLCTISVPLILGLGNILSTMYLAQTSENYDVSLAITLSSILFAVYSIVLSLGCLLISWLSKKYKNAR